MKSIILAASALVLFGVLFGMKPPEHVAALPSPLLLPFSEGETWYVCQGYNGRISHTRTPALDLSLDPLAAPRGSTGCNPSTGSTSKDRVVRAPGAGKVYYADGTYNGVFHNDLVCINFDDGGSALLGHIGNRVASGTHVNASDQVGMVNPPDGMNDGYAHIHVQAYSGRGCGGAAQIAFSDANGARFQGAPDMPYQGDSVENQYSGTPLKRASSSSPNTGRGTQTVFTVDVSGSMSIENKIESAKAAAGSVLDLIAQQNGAGTIQHSAGLVSFDSQASVLTPLTTDITSVKSAVQGLTPLDGTSVLSGLTMSLSALPADNGGNQQIVVLLTDGHDEPPIPESNYDAPIAEAKQRGICVYTVGFGDPSFLDEPLLRKIAEGSGCGQYAYATTDAFDLKSKYLRARLQSSGTLVLDKAGQVSQGQTVDLGSFNVASNTGQLVTTLVWTGSTADITLTDPTGTKVDTNYPGANISTQPTSLNIIIQQPKAGDWKASVSGVDVPEGTMPFYAGASTSAQAAAATDSGGGMNYLIPGFAFGVVAIVIIGGGLVVARPGIRGRTPAGVLLQNGQFTPIGRTGTLTIGRASSNDVVLSDPYVSAQHARIVRQQGQVIVEDLRSTGGTFVRGQRVQTCPLSDGDTIKIGDTSITFRNKKR